MSISEFAQLLHRERTNVYDIFRRKKIDIEQLCKISEALNCDFVAEICEKNGFLKNKPLHKRYLVLEINSTDTETIKTILATIKELKIKIITDIKTNS